MDIDLYHVTVLEIQRAQLERVQRGNVERLRAQGVSWLLIGTALGVTRQAAQQRYGQPAPPKLGRVIDRETGKRPLM